MDHSETSLGDSRAFVLIKPPVICLESVDSRKSGKLLERHFREEKERRQMGGGPGRAVGGQLVTEAEENSGRLGHRRPRHGKTLGGVWMSSRGQAAEGFRAGSTVGGP